MKVFPIDIPACQPQLADTLPKEFNVRLVFVMMPKRRNRQRIPRTVLVRMLHGQNAEGPSRSDFQENTVEENAVLEPPHVAQGIAEPGRVIGMLRPIGRVCGLGA